MGMLSKWAALGEVGFNRIMIRFRCSNRILRAVDSPEACSLVIWIRGLAIRLPPKDALSCTLLGIGLFDCVLLNSPVFITLTPA